MGLISRVSSRTYRLFFLFAAFHKFITDIIKMAHSDQKFKLKLYYFGIAAKGEPIRLALKHAGLEFEDFRFKDYQEFLAMKASGELMFGQVPALEVVNGDRKALLTQSAAILRFIAKVAPQANLYPRCPIQAAQVDAILDQEADAFAAFRAVHYRNRFGLGELTDEQTGSLKKCINADVIPKQFELLEKQLTASKTEWFASCDAPSIADFQWASCLEGVLKGWTGDKDVLDVKRFPKLAGLVDKFHAVPAVTEYYKNQEYKIWW